MNKLVALLLLFSCYAFSSTSLVWDTAQTLSAAGENANTVHIAGDSSGHAIIVWYRNDGADDRIQETHTSDYGDSWSSPATISDAAGDAAAPDVAMDESGHAIIVWYRNNGVDRLIQEAHSSDYGASWSSPTDLSAAGQDAEDPLIAMDNSGNAIAVWFRSDGANDLAQAANSSDYGATWATPTTLSAAGENVNRVKIAMDLTGHAIVTWYRSDGSKDRAQESHSADYGATWSAASTLSGATVDARRPEPAIDRTGHALILWYTDNTYVERVYSSDYGATWSSPTTISSTGYVNVYPQIQMFVGDGAGHAVSIWTAAPGGVPTILGSYSTDYGVTWATFQSIHTGTESPNLAIQATASNAVASWRVSDGSNNRAMASNSDDYGVTWATPQYISEAGENALTPEVVLNGTGSTLAAIAAFGRSDGSNTRAQAAKGEHKSNALSIRYTRQDKISFPWEIDLVNRIGWYPPTLGTPTAYRIFADSNKTTLLDVVQPDSVSYEVHNRKKGVIYTYWITWTDASGFESTPVEAVVP